MLTASNSGLKNIAVSTNLGTDYYAAYSRLALSDYVDSSIFNGGDGGS